MGRDAEDHRYKVVVNHEEEHSIWPVEQENPPGWKAEGFEGARKECLDHIEEVWTDMRPLSLRRKMEAMEKQIEEDGRQK